MGANLASEIEKQAQELVNDSTTALFEANDNSTHTQAQHAEIRAEIAKYTAKVNEMEQLTKSLKEEADAARKAEAEAAAQARSAVDKEEEMLRKHQNKSVWNKIVDGTVQMFTGVRPYQPTPGWCGRKEMMEKEQRAEEERKKIQDSLREQNKVLADNVAALRGFSCDANGLEETIKCLKTVVSILCKVVTTFKNVRLFWECMVGHCQVLANKITDKGFNELGDTNMEALAGKIEAILADMAKDDAELKKLDVAEQDAASKRQKIGER